MATVRSSPRTRSRRRPRRTTSRPSCSSRRCGRSLRRCRRRAPPVPITRPFSGRAHRAHLVVGIRAEERLRASTREMYLRATNSPGRSSLECCSMSACQPRRGCHRGRVATSSIRILPLTGACRTVVCPRRMHTAAAPGAGLDRHRQLEPRGQAPHRGGAESRRRSGSLLRDQGPHDDEPDAARFPCARGPDAVRGRAARCAGPCPRSRRAGCRRTGAFAGRPEPLVRTWPRISRMCVHVAPRSRPLRLASRRSSR